MDAASTVVPPEAQPRSLYAVQFLEAVQLYNDHKYDECITLARYNLTDPTLPRYYHIKTLLLIVNAEEDWYPAERCRREAEDVYSMAQRLTTPEDEPALAALRTLRKDLDTVAASQEKEAPNVVDERFLVPGFDPENMEWESGEEEEEEEVVGVEEDMAVGTEQQGDEAIDSQQHGEEQQVVQGGLRRNRSHELPALEDVAARAPIVVPQNALPDDADTEAEPAAHTTNSRLAPRGPREPHYMMVTKSASMRRRH
ncbi:hypothetical protein LTR56_020282 [Elasticomyces elasticus]|nr:hypothetical protein LTR56_020282 [Elasticomyces elasticus]KAK3644550.1 hypothetical protein LTR22_015148 [Elasticomyces elasticus]KAK4910402.1 hypothetical protein LTR49_020918 [Elasticomyces elasticus]KAK5750067.1 hypothetical protein LTS12_019872 [Elasticomyces elasticus]